jgi:LysM repeat protein
MKNNHLLLIVICILLTLGLVACVKPATKATEVVETEVIATSETSFPLPGSSDDVMQQLEAFATQTAVALNGPMNTAESPIVAGETAVPETTELEGTPKSVEIGTTPEPTKEVKPDVVVPTATPGIPKTYTLKKGEHPYCIARRFDVNPSELLRLSGLSEGGTYSAGTVLKIPQSGNPFPGKRELRNHPTTYTVVSGDTIYSIACLYGDVSPEAIAYANSLEAPYNISAGDELKIP